MNEELNKNQTVSSKPNDIVKFEGKYEFLSNEYNCEVKYENYVFQSAAALFYALKAIDKGAFRKFQRMSPLKAKSKMQLLPPNEDYEEHKEYYLEKAVRAKFDSNPNLVKLLLKTGEAKLLNNVTHLDDWIGIRKDKGYNALGKVLMKLRDEYKSS